MPGTDTDELHALLLELVRSIGLLHVVGAGPTGQVSLSELLTLHELDGGEPLAQQDLADRLRLDKSTVSRLVAGLESRGLLVRERDPGNRRVVRLRLAPAGRRLHRNLARAIHEHQARLLTAMSARERAALTTGLTGLLRALHTPGHPDPRPHR
ncbi:MAG TPA: MarR family transcriptional regulator [Kineosporiaceae bacterium]|nr:MarR family transcriptional regulator [Kineosporiaceae bacterium]